MVILFKQKRIHFWIRQDKYIERLNTLIAN